MASGPVYLMLPGGVRRDLPHLPDPPAILLNISLRLVLPKNSISREWKTLIRRDKI